MVSDSLIGCAAAGFVDASSAMARTGSARLASTQAVSIFKFIVIFSSG
jgi:hypothetical protein